MIKKVKMLFFLIILPFSTSQFLFKRSHFLKECQCDCQSLEYNIMEAKKSFSLQMGSLRREVMDMKAKLSSEYDNKFLQLEEKSHYYDDQISNIDRTLTSVQKTFKKFSVWNPRFKAVETLSYKDGIVTNDKARRTAPIETPDIAYPAEDRISPEENDWLEYEVNENATLENTKQIEVLTRVFQQLTINYTSLINITDTLSKENSHILQNMDTKETVSNNRISTLEDRFQSIIPYIQIFNNTGIETMKQMQEIVDIVTSYDNLTFESKNLPPKSQSIEGRETLCTLNNSIINKLKKFLVSLNACVASKDLSMYIKETLTSLQMDMEGNFSSFTNQIDLLDAKLNSTSATLVEKQMCFQFLLFDYSINAMSLTNGIIDIKDNTGQISTNHISRIDDMFLKCSEQKRNITDLTQKLYHYGQKLQELTINANQSWKNNIRIKRLNSTIDNLQLNMSTALNATAFIISDTSSLKNILSTLDLRMTKANQLISTLDTNLQKINNSVQEFVNVSSVRFLDEKKSQENLWNVFNNTLNLTKNVSEIEMTVNDFSTDLLNMKENITVSMQYNGLLEQKIDDIGALIKRGVFQITLSNMQNLALHKNATQSSEFSSKYPASNAVNNKLQDITHTIYTINPWLRIDLGQRYRIYQIDIINRNEDCCAGRLHDLDVKVGLSINNMTSCGFYKGPARKAEKIQIACPIYPSTVAQFVELQIVSSMKSYLHVSEVRVWGLDL